ncbi:MAG: P-II family nitrogen regulator [Salinivirgaceae bacterium]
MKSIFIVYNQAHTEKVAYMLDHFGVRGYTQWNGVAGRGSESGDPHLGTHTWPEQNQALLAVVSDDKVEEILETVKKIDEINTDVGIRAFVWNIEQMV